MQILSRPSPNFGPRRGGARPSIVVIHYTAMASAEAALERLCDPAAEVSAHYLIAEDGRAWGLVEEAERAWHAGRGAWRRTDDVNSCSIGIELANPGPLAGFPPFPEPQMAALEGLLTPDKKVESRGLAEVREIFHISKVGKIAGCYIREGLFNRNFKVRVVRDGVPVIESAELDSLRRFKDDVKEVKSGFECGIRIAKFDDVKPGDVIEAFEVIEIARTLEMSSR